MRSARFTPVVMCLLLCWTSVQAADYPLTLAASAQVTKGATTITTTLTIRVERPMNGTFRTRVIDALKFGGYPNFLQGAPPAAGHRHDRARWRARWSCVTRTRNLREKGSRLVLAADSPMFFLGSQERPRAGYELTLVELTLDAKGSGKGA